MLAARASDCRLEADNLPAHEMAVKVIAGESGQQRRDNSEESAGSRGSQNTATSGSSASSSDVAMQRLRDATAAARTRWTWIQAECEKENAPGRGDGAGAGVDSSADLRREMRARLVQAQERASGALDALRSRRREIQARRGKLGQARQELDAERELALGAVGLTL